MDCGKLDLAKECYMNALAIRHTRAHQGLARVYHQKSQRKAAYVEMTKLIEKAARNASAYEKRSEYCDRDMAKTDLDVATQLDPLRTYPYRYRAAGNFFTFFHMSLFLSFFLGLKWISDHNMMVLICHQFSIIYQLHSQDPKKKN